MHGWTLKWRLAFHLKRLFLNLHVTLWGIIWIWGFRFRFRIRFRSNHLSLQLKRILNRFGCIVYFFSDFLLYKCFIILSRYIHNIRVWILTLYLTLRIKKIGLFLIWVYLTASAVPYIYCPLSRNVIKVALAYFALLLFFFFDDFSLSEEVFEVALQILKLIIRVILKLMQNENELWM
jgi:hypothetical protein